MISLTAFEQIHRATPTNQNSRNRTPMYQPIAFTLRCPLVDLHTCSAITRQSVCDLTLACESGEILYSFNVSLHPGKRAIRVLALSLREYMDGVKTTSRNDTPAALRAAVAELFPALSETIDGANFGRVLGVSPAHVSRLLTSKALQCASTTNGRGPGSSARIYRRSAIEWLCSRRVMP